MRETKEIQRKIPKNCHYWRDPKQIKSGLLQDRFELLKTYVKDEHFWQYLLKCRKCGQQYVMEFRESIDWVNGNDPQFTLYVPVSDEIDADYVLSAGLQSVSPRLHDDFPSDAEDHLIYWVAEVRATLNV